MIGRNPKLLAAVVLVAIAVPAAPAAGAEADAGDPAERIETLDNGLRVIVRERHLGGVAAFRIYLRAGSLNEDEYTGAGISHLLEHVVSGGTTATRTEDEIRDRLEAIGAQTNAHTSKQYVCYHGQVGAEHVTGLIDVIADYVMNSEIDAEEYAREYEVVQRELERNDANPRRVLWQLADETFFHAHPARHPVIGHLAALRRLSRDDLVTYYNRVARPGNAVAVAVGDFDADAVFDHIREVMGGWKPRAARPTVLPERTPQTGPRRAEREMDVAAVSRVLAWPTVRLTHPDLYPLDVLAYILGEGKSSRLVADLRQERNLVQSVGCYSVTPAGYDGGRFIVHLVSEPTTATTARDAALRHVDRVAEMGVTAEELGRAKRQKIAEHVYRLQTCEAVATDLGTSQLLVGAPDFSDRYVANIQNVSAADVQRVARTYVKPELLTETVLRPTTAPAAEPAPEADQKDAPKKKGPEIIMRTLANGVRLLLCPVEGEKAVSIQMCTKGGLSFESEDTVGTTQMLARMLTRGAGDLSAREIDRRVDAMGAEVSASSGRNVLYLSARCLAEDFRETWDLASAAMLEPDLPQGEIGKVRAQMLAELAQLTDSPQGEARLYFQRMFFRDSPYRFPVLGRAEVLKKLDRAALAAWHRKLVAGENLVVAIFGGIDLPADAAYAARALETIPAETDLPVPKDVQPREVPAREVYVKETGKPIAIVHVAYPGFDVFNVRDRFPVAVLDTIMSGYRMPGGWLHSKLRGEGLVYEVHAYAMAGLRPGYFGAYAVTRPDRVPEVVKAIEDAMKRARTEEFTGEELRPAKATIVTAMELGRERLHDWAFEAALNEAMGLGYGFAREAVDHVRNVEPGDVGRVADEYLTKPVITVLTQDPAAAEKVR